MRRGCGYGSYILDIGEVPFQGTVSGTGCSSKSFKESDCPYYRRGGGREAPQRLLDMFGNLNSGMSVTRAAIAIGNNHYPELMARVIFLRSNWLFAAAFRIFSLWVHKRSREKFIFVEGGGWGSLPLEALQRWYSSEQLPEEFGGTGWRLDGDHFIRSAINSYDTDPTLSQTAPAPQRYAGWTDEERRSAEVDCAHRRAHLKPLQSARAPAEEGDGSAKLVGCLRAPGARTRRPSHEEQQDEQDEGEGTWRSDACCFPCLAWRWPPRNAPLRVKVLELEEERTREIVQGGFALDASHLTLPVRLRRREAGERTWTKSATESCLEVLIFFLWAFGILAALVAMGVVAVDMASQA
eukprot:SRR837773.7112.p1 GENE.SRR837773.7112~~SRR837773.7112.p1  ORF type:complete len:353 (-),score=48.92 SRR837773.7112:30-1088(-)